ncbi:uncharacterized protein LOC123198517 [Mangifera indica]|uniref:uncharacterized protein LOC123198500 n=1 Tax=Mangifera indica TaxID=29780 RepID=UPI001CFC1F1C|nr:uncharacterized protein LOC123198500 [Mangifera indica]XP_044469136.1 uncharacterized protein LOC123198517 [Mangifera indica]
MDYEPDLNQYPVPSQLLKIEKNLRASLELVNQRKIKLVNNSPSNKRRHKFQKKQTEKKRSIHALYSHKFDGKRAFGHTGQNPTSSDHQLQSMQSNPGSDSYRSKFHGSPNEEFLAQLNGNRMVSNYSGNPIPIASFPSNYFPGFSSSSTPGFQIPQAFSPIQLSKIGYRNTFEIPNQRLQMSGNFSMYDLPEFENVGVSNNNLKFQNIISPSPCQFMNWNVNNVTVPLKSGRNFSGNVTNVANNASTISNNFQVPYFTSTLCTPNNVVINDVIEDNNNNNGNCYVGLDQLDNIPNEAEKGDGILSTTGNLQKDPCDLDDLNWDIEVNLDDL